MDEVVEPNPTETMANEILDDTMLDLNPLNLEASTTKVTLEDDRVAVATLAIPIKLSDNEKDSHMKLGMGVSAPIKESEEVHILREKFNNLIHLATLSSGFHRNLGHQETLRHAHLYTFVLTKACLTSLDDRM